MSAGLLQELRGVVGEQHVLTGELAAGYAVDWTGRWRGSPLAVVRPGDGAQVAAVVRACAAAGVAVVPQGGNTGLVGAAAPADGEVVLSTTRLNRVAVDPAARTLTAGAGTTLAAAQRAAREHGLDVGVDLASRDTATLGGIVATNAGGARVLRHGVTRTQVLGLEAVLADGEVVRRMNGLPKDNVGYDLVQLLVGSEGTLGVLTEVMLRVFPVPAARATALVAVPDLPAAAALTAALRTALPGLDAAEFFTARGLRLVLGLGSVRPPFTEEHPVYLLVETVGAAPADDLAEALVEALGEASEVLDAAVATAAGDRTRLWELREAHTEAVATGDPVKLDVAVPVDALGTFLDRLPGVVAAVAPSADPIVFGHLAEGNVHVNVLGARPADADGAVTDAVLELVAELGGSISAEHGIGRAKRRWLHLGRSPRDIAAMHAVKAALDPAGTLSPARVLP